MAGARRGLMAVQLNFYGPFVFFYQLKNIAYPLQITSFSELIGCRESLSGYLMSLAQATHASSAEHQQAQTRKHKRARYNSGVSSKRSMRDHLQVPADEIYDR